MGDKLRRYIYASAGNGLFEVADKEAFTIQARGYADKYSHCRVITAIFPNTIYQINSTNNVVGFTEDDGLGGTTALTATLNEGTYSQTEFLTEIKTRMDAASAASGNSYTYTFSVSGTTGKMTITSSSNTFRMDLSSSDVVTGFSGTSSYANSLTGDNTINLNPIDTCFIRGFGTNVFNSRANNSDTIVAIIPLGEYSFGSYVHFEPTNPMVIDAPNSAQIYVALTDEEGNILNLNSTDGLKLVIEFFDA